jgi:two-component system, LuxR family, response regulator FixJ
MISPATEPPALAPGRDTRKSVVLVDDDAAVLSSLKFALEMEGFAVEAYQSGAEVIANMDPQNIGCLILDYHLPGPNGLDLLRALRGVGIVAPAVIITTNPTLWLRQNAATEGVAIVEKPLLGDALLEAVRTFLKGSSR